jgi:hypothetical protein
MLSLSKHARRASFDTLRVPCTCYVLSPDAGMVMPQTVISSPPSTPITLPVSQ